MKRKKWANLVLVVVGFVLIGVPCCFVFWPESRQVRLDRQLLHAIRRGDTGSALRLLAEGADANACDREVHAQPWQVLWFRPSARNETPLLLSMRLPPKDNAELVKALLAHGANVDAHAFSGDTPLWLAITNRQTTAALLLIERGAHTRGNSALKDLLTQAVLYESDPKEIELILHRGADPNVGSADGYTPLGCAIMNNDTVRVQCLLRNHADPNRPTMFYPDVMRPLAYAEKNHMTAIAKMLRNAGAKK